MVGDRKDIYSPAQYEMWKLLGDTRVVADAVRTGPTPWQAEDRDAKVPGRADAQIKDRGARSALDLGKSGTAWANAGAAKGKQKLTIARARWGNRPVIARRD